MCFSSSSKFSSRIGTVAVLLLTGPLVSYAQSGRQPPKPPHHPNPATAVTDVATPDSTVAKKLGSLQQHTKVLIARQTTERRLPTEDVVYASLVNRLNEYANLEGLSIGNMKRTEAVTRAKSEPASFVVWLDFEVDRFQSGTIILNSPDLVIEYSILAPRTAKQMSKGKVFFQAIGGGRLRKSDWPGGTPIRITPEAAGIGIAEQLFDWLRLDEVRKRRRQE